MTDVSLSAPGRQACWPLSVLRISARKPLVTSGAFGGMAANDGPVPVRTLAHADRLMPRPLGQYGVKVSEPVMDYSRLLARVREVDSVAVKAAHELGLAIGWQAHQAA
jgi:pyruvate/2-oxoglutarate dehydrogenase complex dihydrolipoamide dehydrogenase (E3) component